MLVTLGDVDSAGVLFFASVYRWHERVFFEWLAEIGQPLQEILSTGRGLPVRSSSAEYPSSAVLGDDLSVSRRVSELAGTEFVFQTAWSTGERRVAEVSTKHVTCGRNEANGLFVRRPIWPELRAQLERIAS